MERPADIARLNICVMLVLPFLLISLPAAADVPSANPGDVKTLQDCLKATEKKPGQPCIGKVVDKCAPKPDQVSMQAMAQCYAREYAAWEAVLGDASKDLAGILDNDAKTKLSAVQTSWTAARNQTCDFLGAAAENDLRDWRRFICYQTETANRVYLFQSMKGLF